LRRASPDGTLCAVAYMSSDRARAKERDPFANRCNSHNSF
jgi:hypothetical protein